MAFPNPHVDDVCGEEETGAILSQYSNITPGQNLLVPSYGAASIIWSGPNHRKNSIQSQSEWSSTVGVRIGTSSARQELGYNNMVPGNSDCYGEANESPESLISPPSVLVEPLDDLQFSENEILENCTRLTGEEVENELRKCTDNSGVSSTSDSDVGLKFVALECDKKKNPPYLLYGNSITTKNDTAVKFHLKGARAGQEARITLRYADPVKKDSPVTVCKEHRCDSISDPRNDCTFWIAGSDCHYKCVNGHSTAIIPIREDSHKDGTVEFCLVFKCLNSCHRNQAKKIDLLMTVVDPTFQNVQEETQRFNIRVCKNVKRDHKDRKRCSEEIFDEIPEKAVKQEPAYEQPGSSLHIGSSAKPFRMLLTPEKEKVLLPLLKFLDVPVSPCDQDLLCPDPSHFDFTSHN